MQVLENQLVTRPGRAARRKWLTLNALHFNVKKFLTENSKRSTLSISEESQRGMLVDTPMLRC